METETKKVKHTPTPWAQNINAKYPIYTVRDHVKVAAVLYSENGYNAPKLEEANANLKFIVRAVNSHQELLEAAKVFVDHHRQVPAVEAGGKCVCGHCARFLDAIDIAEGESR